MYGFSIFCLSIGAFFSAITYRLIEGYFSPSFVRGTFVDEDGYEGTDLVWNDWWPGAALIAIFGLWAGAYVYKEWVKEVLKD